MLKLLELAGNPNLGVYVRATDAHVFYADSASRREAGEIESTLEVPGVPVSIGGSHVVGSLMAGNRRGLVVADIVFEAELRKIQRAGLHVSRLAELLNAAGNNILCNDHGALVNPEYSDAAVSLIHKALGVPVHRGTLAELGTVGMAGVATSRGVLVHPKSTPEEREAARRILGADVMVGTVNHGTGLIGAGLVANARGALIGRGSTGIELSRIEEALGFLPAAAP